VAWFLATNVLGFVNEFGLKFDFSTLHFWAVTLAGGVGGYALGTAWREAQPGLGKRLVWQLTAGWALCWALGDVALGLLDDRAGVILAWAFGGLAAGLLGGGLMLWQARAAARDGTAPAPPRDAGAPRPVLGLMALAALLALLALGWAVALLAGQGLVLLARNLLADDKLYSVLAAAGFVLAGALGGWATGLALRLAAPEAGWKQLPIGAAVWGVAFWAAGLTGQALHIFSSELSLGLTDMQVGELSLAAGGALGGWLMAANWRRSFPGLHRRQGYWVAGGSALALVMGSVVQNAIHALGGNEAAWLVGWAAAGAVAGVIGGGVTLWVFTRRDVRS
jgi:hypothetical protein